MADPANHIKNIAIVGASGTVGAPILKHLLKSNTFNITVLTRSNSTSTFPIHPSITVKKGSYTDQTFLSTAFANQDALILALGFMAMDQQPALIEAAAKAGIKWILPTEYAADGLNKSLMDAVPLYYGKGAARKQIEELAETYEGLKWIGVATNPWTEFSLVRGMFGIDIPAKKFVFYEDGGKFNTSTIEQVGKGVAALLCLPIRDAERPRVSLEYYANNFGYISSFLTTQQELFEAVLKATRTNEADWYVERSTIEGSGGRIAKAQEELKKGNFMGGADVAYGYYMGDGLGGNYEEKARADREVLGLEVGDLDRVMAEVVKTVGDA